MKYIIGKHIVSGLLAVGLVLLTGCQSDGGDTTGPRKVSVEMRASARTYGDAVPKASTRTWPPSSDFEVYSGHDAIRVAFTKNASIALDGAADGSFVFVPGDNTVVPNIPDKWMSSFVLPSTGSYYL